MAHILSPEAEAELDDIWYYIARESGNADIADRFIDSLTDRFYLLTLSPYIGRRRDRDLRPGMRSFPVWASTSFSTASKKATCEFFMWYGAAGTYKRCSAFRLDSVTAFPPERPGSRSQRDDHTQLREYVPVPRVEGHLAPIPIAHRQ
jgi:plasmid stabilization system protein ParE